MQMNIILLEDIDGLGHQYDEVTVKGGYGRNFLLPKKKAVIANKSNKARIGEIKRQIEMKAARTLQRIEDVMERLRENPIQIGAKVGTTDKIFGSVNNVQLAEAIKKQCDIDIDRRKISIPEEVKTLGSYKALLNLGQDHKYEFDFEVIAE